MVAVAPRRQWVLASHNAGKVRELMALFENSPVRLRPASAFDLPEPEESGPTFEANAALKASAAMNATGMVALADDSGVEAHALNGEPGIHTARWAGPDKDFAFARERLRDRLTELGPGADRRATYVCVLCVARPGASCDTFRGETHGFLVWPPRGDLGHGFEPVFLPDGYAVTYGEMTPERRLRVNARAQAIRKLAAASFLIGDT